MHGRVYDYNVGRFISVDPFLQGNGNSQGINPYSYIMNNPLATIAEGMTLNEVEFGIVTDDQGDAGLYFSYSGSEEYGRNRGIGLEFGKMQGNILDFSGNSRGVTLKGQEVTVGQNGNYGIAAGLKVAYSTGGIITNTKVVSYRTILGNAQQIYGDQK